MIIKAEKLKNYLKRYNLTKEDFADQIEISVIEVEKMLGSEFVGLKTARMFIYNLGAGLAQEFIDWDALGVKNPLVGGKHGN